MEPPAGMTLTPQHIINDRGHLYAQHRLSVNYIAAGNAFIGLALGAQAFLRTLERGMAELSIALSEPPMPRWRAAEIRRRIDHKYAKNRRRLQQSKSHLQLPRTSQMHAAYRRKKR